MIRAILALVCLLAAPCGAGTFVVTNTQSSGEGSFRWAVNQTNEHAGPDTILFAIPERDPGHDPARGVWTIAMGDDFPNYNPYSLRDDSTFVDGFSQRRFIGGDPNPLGPEIELRPSPLDYPTFSACITSWRNSIRLHGLCINGFGWYAVSLSAWTDSTFVKGAEIIGCYLGVDPTGTYVESYTSKAIGATRASGLRIGGDGADERVIAVGEIDDIWLSECGDVSVINSYLGVDRTGTVALAYPWFFGITILKPQGSILIRDCVIGGDRAEQVSIGAQYDEPGTVTLLRNRIGVGVDGAPMGAYSYGISVGHCGGHLIRENVVAYVQSWWGIELWGNDTDYVTISRNSIYGCHRLGINLCQRAYEVEAGNAVDYVDGQYGPGPNEEIDPCLCDSVRNVSDAQGGTTTAYFTCMRDCTVEVFVGDEEGSNLPCSMAGFGRVYSGRTYLGDAEEVSQGSVFSTYRFRVSPGLSVGTHLTATATNRNGSTSEFGCSGVVPYPGQTAEGCSGAGDAFLVEGANPGSGDMVLRYRLARPGRVEIMAYTLAGELAARVMDGVEEAAGEHVIRWQPRDARGKALPSGAYVMRMVADRSVLSARAVVLR